MNNADKKTVSLPEFARIMGISRSLAYKMAAEGQINVIRLGMKRIVVPIAVVKKMLSESDGEGFKKG